MNGWAGNVLRVDLTQGDYSIEELDPDLAESFLGGRGLAAKILYDEIDPQVDAFSPENKLILAVGPLTATNIPATSRYMSVTKSPLTGGIACGNAGGFFGPEMKFAGFDVIIVEGKSPEPVYILIENNDVNIVPAKHLWGMTTAETEKAVKAEMGDEWKARDTQVISIGPAGENLVRMACIMNDGHAAARSGTGAVMGSKNLKAIAVRGTKGVNIADSERLREALKAIVDERIRGSKFLETWNKYGTWILMRADQTRGSFPTWNFKEGYFEELADFDEESFAQQFRVGIHSCFGCPFATHKITDVKDPEYAGCGVGPEYETFASLGPCCGVSNLSAITRAGHLCNDMGLDSIDTGVTIACAMELFEKGVITEQEAGYKLNFGNTKAMVELVEKMGRREGFGDILAEGGYRMAEKYGHPELFMGSKKQAMPLHHPQANQGSALGFATSNQGACHTRVAGGGAPATDPFKTEGQAEGVKTGQDWISMGDSLGLCWPRSAPSGNPFIAEDFPNLMEAVTGLEYSIDDLRLIGERIWNIERLFNLKAGLTAEDDTLPKRMLEEPMTLGASAGHVCKLDEMLPEYYHLRGWDENGVPTPEKLEELGLG